MVHIYRSFTRFIFFLISWLIGTKKIIFNIPWGGFPGNVWRVARNVEVERLRATFLYTTSILFTYVHFTHLRT